MKKKEKKRSASGRTPSGMPGTRISLCMMVKNEEDLLPQALGSIRDFVDEIIVVDTGSTDRTVEIAESFGAKIYHHPWENDFSRHRNQTLEYATGGWVLILDADEELQEGDGPVIREMIRRCPARVSHILFRVEDVNPRDGKITNEIHSIRMFRNGMGFHYRSIVHNQLQVPSGDPLFSSVTLRHYGYHLDPARMEEKFQRRIALLNRQLRDRPGDPYTLFNLANAWFEKDLEKCLWYGRLLVDSMRSGTPFPPVCLNVFYCLMAAHMNEGAFDAAIEACEAAIGLCEHYVDAHYILCDACLRSGRYVEAVRAGENYLRSLAHYRRHRREMRHLWVHMIDGEADVLLGIGISSAAAGHLEQGREYLDRFLRRKGPGPGDWKRLLESLESVSPRDGAWDLKARYLEQALCACPENGPLLQLSYLIYRRGGRFSGAIDCLRRLRELDGDPGWQVKEAELHVERGDPAAALTAVAGYYAENPLDWRCNLLLMKISMDMGRPAGSGRFLENAFRSLVAPEKGRFAAARGSGAMLSRMGEVLREKDDSFYAALVESLPVPPEEMQETCSTSP